MPPVEPWIDNALTHHLPADFDSTRLIVPFTFDWGVCNTVLHDLWRVRDWSSVNEMMERISSWQPMGDLNSPCEWLLLWQSGIVADFRLSNRSGCCHPSPNLFTRQITGEIRQPKSGITVAETIHTRHIQGIIQRCRIRTSSEAGLRKTDPIQTSLDRCSSSTPILEFL